MTTGKEKNLKYFVSFLSFQALQWTSTEGLQTTCAAALELPNLNYV